MEPGTSGIGVQEPEQVAAAPPVSRRIALVAALLAAQTLCAAFFVGDVAFDMLPGREAGREGMLHLWLETLAAATLAASVAVTALEVRRLMARQRRMEAGMAAASGAFLDHVEDRFERWRLTPSERDVGLLALKGLSIAEIAAVRGRSPGTVKAQLGAIYAKAGVTGRPQLISSFVEDLLGGGLGEVRAA